MSVLDGKSQDGLVTGFCRTLSRSIFHATTLRQTVVDAVIVVVVGGGGGGGLSFLLYLLRVAVQKTDDYSSQGKQQSR